MIILNVNDTPDPIEPQPDEEEQQLTDPADPIDEPTTIEEPHTNDAFTEQPDPTGTFDEVIVNRLEVIILLMIAILAITLYRTFKTR